MGHHEICATSCGEAKDQPSVPSQPDMADSPSFSLLLVDDMEDNRMLISLFLKALPCRLAVAANGSEGVRSFQCDSYDLVLMDLQMPVMDGYDATRAIRAWETVEGRPATPIIALTASTFEEDMEKAYQAGVTAHLPKPITKARLFDTVRRYVPLPPGKQPTHE